MIRESFTLKSGVDNFAGGSVAYGPDGETIDLAPLVVPGAVITVQTEMQAAALRDLEVLKSAPSPEEDEELYEHGDGDAAILSNVSKEEAQQEQKRLHKEGPAPVQEEEAPSDSSSSSGSTQGAAGSPSGSASGVTTPPVQPAPTGAPAPGKTSTGGEK